MEFPEEIIQETGLNEEQLGKISEYTDTILAEKEKEWSGKANENAERIIESASNAAKQKFGLSGENFERQKGEKYADFLTRITPGIIDSALGKEKSLLKNKEKELNDKLKNSGHNDTLVAELDEVKGQLDKLKEKEAQFAEWEENDYKGKYESISQEHENMKREVAFNKVKPSFPENVNKYEADFKWNQFQKDVQDKYNIKIVDGEAIAIDKENEYKQVKLADLVKKDENLTALTKGTQSKGFGSKPKGVKIEGVPFDVPEEATSKERTALIKEYLSSKGLSPTGREYAKQFAELNQKILSQKTAK
jgi:hypothetical protein